jgi:hypothetical protein
VPFAHPHEKPRNGAQNALFGMLKSNAAIRIGRKF